MVHHQPAAAAAATSTASQMANRTHALPPSRDAPAPKAEASAPVTRQYPKIPGSPPFADSRR
ncbi:hypothetical protein GCM10010245_75920 [Streptomyces spectabilis]|uniref:Uncharacterized protein n=1 Tax=Streptomyces spectabilis TaxID=68270 RepID=A0A7W8B0R8_STRST|nr:hypothetical protein [Streptomyces spectabilis]GGV48249.1 hypothetical protein GCM10010245_75920 [Streptomyces spectabilis]